MAEQTDIEIMNETLSLAEEALDSIENTLDLIEQVPAIRMKNNPTVLAGVAVVALAVGGYVGYRIASKKLEQKYVEIADVEIAQAKEFYKRSQKVEEFATPESAVEALIPEDERKILETESENALAAVEALRSYKGKTTPRRSIQDVDEEPVPVIQNIFVNGEAFDPDQDDSIDISELGPRSVDHPYVIAEQEFFEKGELFEKIQLTYFQGDDTLVDDEEDPIHDTEAVCGKVNLTKFGLGSNDPHILYVRNEKRKVDYEITLSENTYTSEVLGLELVEDQVTKTNRRKFRDARDDG